MEHNTRRDDRGWAIALVVGMLLAAGIGVWFGAIIGHASSTPPAGFCVVIECSENEL